MSKLTMYLSGVLAGACFIIGYRAPLKITLFFKWFDFWVGLYFDTRNKAIYICPIPMVGLKIEKK